MSTATFGIWDYLVFGLMMAASISIGIYYAVSSGKRTTISEYFVASKSLTFLPVALSLVATLESSVMMLGTPAESYAHGIQWMLAELASGTAVFIDIFLVLVFVRRMDLSSPFEYLERRFHSRPLRLLANLLACLFNGTIDAGGVAKVWGPALESGRLDFSLDADPTVRHTVWNLYFGRILGNFGFLFNPAVLQRISSTKSLKECRRALFLTIPGFMVMIGIALAEGIVAYGYFYQKRCDPVASKQVDNPNQIIPFMMLDLFSSMPGMAGLFLAALSSASLSTISSCLSATASIVWYDLIKPCRPNMSEGKSVIFAKATVVFMGALGCLLAVIVSFFASRTLTQIIYTVTSATKTPLTALFYLGSLFLFVNTKGATIGLVSGVIFMSWLTIGSMSLPSGMSSSYLPPGPTDHCPGYNMTTMSVNTTDSLVTTTRLYPQCADTETRSRSALETMYSLSYTLFSTLGMAIVIVVGIVASWITGGNKTPVDPACVIHLQDIQLPCIPVRVKRYFSKSNKENESYSLALAEESPGRHVIHLDDHNVDADANPLNSQYE
ncbi:sodium-coupled monocarboxylate transporter 2-like [Haliotis rufescens]|uniref:sodium-coupled monocarboxylate transporter 2-like n=1 Tax=Haliotis rufescens TaxID=6454 RepID=UPI00201F55B4|nr:sodium-coupled monocarboxylate transporter 2-like [Haliotis rufescens]